MSSREVGNQAPQAYYGPTMNTANELRMIRIALERLVNVGERFADKYCPEEEEEEKP